MSVQESASAKVNLFLHVGERRADGFHPLQSLAVFTEEGDVLHAEALVRGVDEAPGPGRRSLEERERREPQGVAGRVDDLAEGHAAFVELEGVDEHLQLALYSSLIEQKKGVAPAALGYFILESGALYITAADAFPNAQVRRPPDGVTITTLLDRARATWNWRKQQLDAGTIDIVPEGPPDEFQGPDGTLPVNGPGKWDRDHLVLLGGWQ